MRVWLVLDEDAYQVLEAQFGPGGGAVPGCVAGWAIHCATAEIGLGSDGFVIKNPN